MRERGSSPYDIQCDVFYDLFSLARPALFTYEIQTSEKAKTIYLFTNRNRSCLSVYLYECFIIFDGLSKSFFRTKGPGECQPRTFAVHLSKSPCLSSRLSQSCFFKFGREHFVICATWFFSLSSIPNIALAKSDSCWLFLIYDD